MAQANTTDLHSRVKAYIHNWEMDLCKKLKSAKMSLMWCVQGERAHLKSKIETLNAVLELFHGKREMAACDTQNLSDELLTYKLKLTEARVLLNETTVRLKVQERISRDLKTQLMRQSETVRKTEKMNRELCHQIKEVRDVFQLSRLSLESCSGKLGSKLDRKLQSPASLRSTEVPPAPPKDLLKPKNSTTGKSTDTSDKIQGPVVKMEELKPDLHLTDVEPVKENNETKFCIKASQLKNIKRNSVAPVEDDDKAVLENHKMDILKVRLPWERARDQLEVPHPEALPQESTERFEEKESQLKEVTVRKRKKRNWFVRMFMKSIGNTEN